MHIDVLSSAVQVPRPHRAQQREFVPASIAVASMRKEDVPQLASSRASIKSKNVSRYEYAYKRNY